MKSRGRFDANSWSKHLRDLRDERCKDKRMWWIDIDSRYLHADYPTHRDIENTTTSFKGFRLEYDQPPVESNKGGILKWFKQMLNSMFSKGDK